MMSTQFWIRFWSHSNRFLEKSVCKSTFSQVLFIMQFLQNVILIFLDRSKCRANSDMLSSIPMKFNKMQNKFLYIQGPICAIHYSLETLFKSSKLFVLFVSDMSLQLNNNFCLRFPIVASKWLLRLSEVIMGRRKVLKGNRIGQ